MTSPLEPNDANTGRRASDRGAIAPGAPFPCVLIGRGPQLVACAEQLLQRGHRVLHVVSDCPVAAAWAQRVGVSRLEPHDYVGALRREPFDWLFSIVNHAITPPEVLALARRGAINYHDSLLPAYGGFHATTWAILDGRAEHGITWHRMTADVDAGGYLVQKTFAIGEQDTAFSLTARASELGARSFGEVLAALASGRDAPAPGLPVRDFHRKSERPGYAVIDCAQPATAALRLVRAFDFGDAENWTTRAKLETPSGEFVCVGAAAPGSGSARAGTVVRATANGVAIAVADGVVELTDLATLAGDPVDAAAMVRLGLAAGALLPAFSAARAAAAAKLDAEVTKVERSWVERLQQQAIPHWSELRLHAPAGELREVAVPLPDAFAAQPAAAQRALFVAALAAYAARVGDGSSRADIALAVDALPAELARLYASTVPLSLACDAQAPWSQLVQLAEREIGHAAAHRTHARDVWTRYPALRARTHNDRDLPVAVSFQAPAAALPPVVRLLFELPPAARALTLRFDANAIGALHATRLGERLVHLLAEALRAPATSIAALPLTTRAEQDLLLRAFQDTSRPAVAIACVHELFAARAAHAPDKTALAFRDETITYRELDQRANALAHHLRGLGVGPDALVGIAIERSIEMVVGLLAILKAGGAYVPLDPAYPAERLAMMLEDSGARWLLTQPHLAGRLPKHGASVVHPDAARDARVASPPASGVRPEHLAYVIFTSGSTGRPKGVMVEHRNVANFFAGMDERIGPEPGVWLAVTSISFDISVLELFWTLARGFEVVIQEEGDRASMRQSQARTAATSRPMGFGLFYFAADSTNAPTTDAYRLLLEGARFADTHDFTAVWTPERHFHAFGGLYPNPAVTSAAIATITKRVELRAGSVVIPLHDPLRVAEEWAVVDNLSHGRVGLSFASGWHVNDFALKPENYERRREVMHESIATVLRLWAGEKVTVKNGQGQPIEVGVLPRPVRAKPPMWIASAGNVETFRDAGRAGHNVLTNMLGQDLADLTKKFAAYREARSAAGHAGDGIVSVMLHTFVTDDDEKARELARRPFGNYLQTSYDLVKVAPWMFPAFKQPSLSGSSAAFDPSRFDAQDMAALLDHAFDRYFDTAGLFGTPERALQLVEKLKDIGANEVACLVDFGIDPDVVLANLVHLDELRRLANPGAAAGAGAPRAASTPVSIREQFERREITHFQCTPSLARILLADGTLGAMGSLRRFLVGGEALPLDLATAITAQLPHAELLNMYGPTETTVWSTTAAIARGLEPEITIGTPIANTQIRVLDARMQLLPIGAPGELCIGGHGVVRGYWNRPDLTAERFVADPFAPGNRLYRTGDLARWRDDGAIDYLGRIDQQVKVNGYRIELGEIEAVLARHAAVKQSVVAAKTVNGVHQLVAYVLAAGGAANAKGWQARWDAAYATRAGAHDAPARFDTSGWLSSYTGEPIAEAAMREWLDATVQRILALRPRRVLEVGCGTGMILYGCLPHVEHYTAVDVSPVALERIRAELGPAEREKVTLLDRAAHELDAIPAQSCDVVVINSVAQYFPSADYLTQVLERASRVLADGGAIFVGDVRSLEAARAFHVLVELHQAPAQTGAPALAQRVADRAALDSELLLARGYFQALAQRVPRLRLASIQNKRGAHASEMRDFRCDVVLRAGAPAPVLDLARVPVLAQPASLAAIADALRARPGALLLTVVRDARRERALAAATVLDRGDATATADSLRALLAAPAGGIDADALFAIDAEYDVEVRFGGAAGTLDALLRRRGHAPAGVWPVPAASEAVASTPHARVDGDGLVPRLRAHLREFLPEYMVPAAFLVVDAFPLTPNGKIDRKSLPLPAAEPRQAAAAFAVPDNELERTIASIWQDVLGVAQVGRKDNIFDLGASSLLTVEANSRLQETLGRKIPLVSMFRHPTIEALAAHLAAADAATAPAADATANDERQGRLDAAAERRRQARARTNRP
jgi:natural product biosynthesis luciferase-like monooxygenase protein